MAAHFSRRLVPQNVPQHPEANAREDGSDLGGDLDAGGRGDAGHDLMGQSGVVRDQRMVHHYGAAEGHLGRVWPRLGEVAVWT